MCLALGIGGGREVQTGPFSMGTKAPSETKELRVVACDSLSNEQQDRPQQASLQVRGRRHV